MTDASLTDAERIAIGLNPLQGEQLYDLDDLDESEGYLRLSEARSSTVPVVACYTCQSAFEVSFRRLREPDEWNLPEPCIVETPDTLGGRPRIDGTRIGVEHV